MLLTHSVVPERVTPEYKRKMLELLSQFSVENVLTIGFDGKELVISSQDDLPPSMVFKLGLLVAYADTKVATEEYILNNGK
jgi:hypothetical protein